MTTFQLGLEFIWFDIWSDENVRELNSIMRDSPEIAIMKSDKNAFIKMIQDTYKSKTEKFY